MKKQLSIALLLSFLVFPGVAEESPSDQRIRLLRYDPATVYTITTRYGYQTYIEFSATEEVDTISVGDRSLWQIIPARQRVFIRPMDVGVSTNMTVITNRRAYQFDLKSVDAAGKNVVYVARFNYPDERREAHPPVMVPPVAPPVAPPVMRPPMPPGAVHLPASPVIPTEQAAVAKPQRNYQYTYTGPDPLAPQQTFDDGKATYMKFVPSDKPLPKISLVDAADKETPAEVTTREGYVVVNAVAPKLMLRYPEGTVTLYNEWTGK